MDKRPVISVLMPAFNAEKYIGKAISSVLNQTFTDFELIIIDDGSDDNTVTIINSFKDSRLKLINQCNKGIAVALNNGLSFANADYIARFDADDICMPERLQKQYNFLSQNPDYVIVGCAADYIDMNEEYVFSYSPHGNKNEQIQQTALAQCPFIHSGVMFHKDVIIHAGGYDTHAHTFEDHLLWMNVLKKGKAYNLQEKLIKVRLNPQSVTIDETHRGRKFQQIKSAALKKGFITEDEGNELKGLLQKQDTHNIKNGSYHTLLAKKYLWNNYQPKKARFNLKKTLLLNPADLSIYGLLLLSFMPNRLIQKIYNRKTATK